MISFNENYENLPGEVHKRIVQNMRNILNEFSEENLKYTLIISQSEDKNNVRDLVFGNHDSPQDSALCMIGVVREIMQSNYKLNENKPDSLDPAG